MAPRFAKQPDWTRALLAAERSSTRAVYAVLLAWRPWDDDTTDNPCTTASPARSQIAKEAGLTERSVQRATGRLVEMGLIRKNHRGRGRAQIYSLAWDAPFTGDADPVLLLTVGTKKETRKGDKRRHDPGEKETRSSVVDNSKKETPVSPFTPKKETPVSPYREDYLEDTRGRVGSVTAVGSNSLDNSSSITTCGTREKESEEESAENGTTGNTKAAPVDIVRDRLNAVWPHEDIHARRLVADALAAGWGEDALVTYVRRAATAPGVRNQRAYALTTLGQLPPPPREPERVRSVARPPRDPAEVAEDRARAQRWKAEIRAQLAARRAKDADNGTPAESVRTGAITGRPLPPSAGVFDLGSVLAPTRPPEDVLDAVEGFPSDADVLDALDRVDVLGNPITDDDYADAYAATGTD